ncbi:unnamed protein product [Cyprideis torosa]|uniref:Uncharacterized protein n=1 Tax=Cyprideis torosa TaxID=163714 RepID=A0A7R8W472_9CRUS|nr:unnamed protein product [Cyprideis torosa]CAG0883885.1 unnamed protein product [Cyprideis torosa]
MSCLQDKTSVGLVRDYNLSKCHHRNANRTLDKGKRKSMEAAGCGFFQASLCHRVQRALSPEE